MVLRKVPAFELAAVSNPTVSDYLQALLLTGARPDEVMEMKWADIEWRWESIVIRDKIEGGTTHSSLC